MGKVPSAKGAIYISLGQRPRTMERKATKAKARPIIYRAGFQPLPDAQASVPWALPRLA
jgi:hypothetical protein